MKLAIVLLAAVAALAAEKPKPTLDDNDMRMAYNVGVDWLSERLKAPATARFQPIDELRFNPDGRVVFLRHRITFSLYVDAQNGFGALIRSFYYCGVEKDPMPDGRHKCLCIETRR